MIQRLKDALSQRHRSDLFDRRRHHVVGNRVPSAVIVPVFYKDDECHLLFTQRTNSVRDHKGHISFPGGTKDLQDVTLLDTAVRECREEIGIKPEDLEILGELDNCPTLETNYLITPYVGAIPWPYEFKISPREVAEIIEIPVSVLMNKNNLRHGTEELDGAMITTYFYDYKDKIIWGATARILTQFLDIYSNVLKDKEAGL
jgi:8-oxo-dGTP pyrophosphatase MutT (NUDIX family)